LHWHASRFGGLLEKQHALAVDLIERLRRREGGER
jgi:hypothetical protein